MTTENNYLSCAELRAKARMAFAQNMKDSVLLNLLLFVIFAVAYAIIIAPTIIHELYSVDASAIFLIGSVVCPIFTILFYVIIAALRVGYNKFFLLRSTGVKCNFSTLREGRKKLFRNSVTLFLADLIYYGLTHLIVLLGLILLGLTIAPMLCSSNAPISRFIDGIDLYTRIVGSIVTVLLALFCCIVFYIAYATLELLTLHLAENPDMGFLEVIKTLWAKTKNQNLRLIKLFFSFTGWWLLCIVTNGIAAIWIIPYWNFARAEFYKELFKNAVK